MLYTSLVHLSFSPISVSLLSSEPEAYHQHHRESLSSAADEVVQPCCVAASQWEAACRHMCGRFARMEEERQNDDDWKLLLVAV
jgi:hypothetical protein